MSDGASSPPSPSQGLDTIAQKCNFLSGSQGTDLLSQTWFSITNVLLSQSWFPITNFLLSQSWFPITNFLLSQSWFPITNYLKWAPEWRSSLRHCISVLEASLQTLVSIPRCITTGCVWDSHRVAHNWTSVVRVRDWPW